MIFNLNIALHEEDSIIFVPNYYLNMLRPDFSEIQKNGFRISQFRLVLSPDSKKFSSSKNESTENIIEEKRLIISYLIEMCEIHFTISYFALRLMFLFIFATILSLLSRGPMFFVTYILALLSIILFIISRKYREYFILGDFGINFARSIYDVRIKEKYNF